MPYFKQVLDDEGNETFVEVDFTEDVLEEIPDDVFFNDDRYKTVADRDYKRRQKVKELQEQLSKTGEEDPSDDTEEDDEQPEPVTLQQVQSLLSNYSEEMLTTFKTKLEQEQEEKQQQEASLKSLLEENELDEEALPVLRQSSNPEETAAYLAKSRLRFGGSANADNTPSIQDTLDNVNKRLGID